MLLTVRFVMPQGAEGEWDISEAGLIRDEQGQTWQAGKPSLLLPWVVILRVTELQAEPITAKRNWLWFWRDSLNREGWSRLRRVALNVNHGA